MSLTTFLTLPEIRERFSQEFTKPKMAVNKEIVAPPLSEHYSLVGTAFDYLLRFYIKKNNPNAISREWVAESATNHLISICNQFEQDGKSTRYIKQKVEKAQKILEKAKTSYQKYISSKTMKMPDDLLESTIYLAQLDAFFRAGIINPDFGKAYKSDVVDLRNLINLVDVETIKAKRICLLNPIFGETASLIGGADADLLIDDTIIDIKTTKHLKLSRKEFDQLIGYYILHEIDGMNGITPKPKVKKVAIYFPRFAYLHVFDLNKIVNRDNFPNFINWFATIAKDRHEKLQESIKRARIEYENKQKERRQAIEKQMMLRIKRRKVKK